jgi:hypothetical protein
MLQKQKTTNKHMKQLILLGALLLMIPVLNSCSQPQKLVKKIYAFSLLPQRGNFQVDDKGNELPVSTDTTFIVFVETVSDSIVWKTAWVGNRSYSVVAERINGSAVEPGLNPADGISVTLQPAAGHSFYRLVLTPVQAAGVKRSSAPGTILLEAAFRHKTFEKTADPVRFLSSRPAY